jgi:hypothetical protein
MLAVPWLSHDCRTRTHHRWAVATVEGMERGFSAIWLFCSSSPVNLSESPGNENNTVRYSDQASDSAFPIRSATTFCTA